MRKSFSSRGLRQGLVFLAIVCSTRIAGADVRLAGFFGDHMVVQQNMPIKVWGWAEPGEQIEVTLGHNKADAIADETGKWSVDLPAMVASKDPLTMTVAGNNILELKDVLIGEVWLCSGQSNMEWTVRRCGNADVEIAAANYPLIRHVKIPKRASPTPQEDVSTEWEVCSPETAAEFTAAGYYTAVNLLKELDVPIGLVNSSWGGTRIEPWTTTVGLQKVEALQELYQATMTRTPGTSQYRTLLSEHIAATEKWLTEANANVDVADVIGPSPDYPAQLRPLAGRGEPTSLYNGMIHPLVGLPIRGVLWYQGEANRRDGMMYYEKKKALINGWREIWGQDDFPFYIVQIAPFQYGQDNPEMLAEFWEAQTATLQLSNTGMVVTNDIATLNNIHPPDKQEVGRRLALLALKDIYGRDHLVARSPEFEKLDVMPGKLRVTFKNTGGSLTTRDGKTPTHFEIVGRGSSGFQPATAKIEGNSVILESKLVESPVAYRFAWHKLAEPNLTGATGLPLGAVRAGEVPEFLEMVPGGVDYKLVYELDLANLGREIKYDVDNSASIESFDRVGYLLELKSDTWGEQKVFVSMNAFTDNVGEIGVPTVESKASFQGPVEAMEVFSNVAGLTNATGIKTGNIEFWPNNYGPENEGDVQGASTDLFDIGDRKYGGSNGYGSMQVHNFGAGETIFAVNHWSEGDKADIGIGNSAGDTRDWTFTQNAKDYSGMRLRVFARPKETSR